MMSMRSATPTGTFCKKIGYGVSAFMALEMGPQVKSMAIRVTEGS